MSAPWQLLPSYLLPPSSPSVRLSVCLCLSLYGEVQYGGFTHPTSSFHLMSHHSLYSSTKNCRIRVPLAREAFRAGDWVVTHTNMREEKKRQLVVQPATKTAQGEHSSVPI